MPSALEELKNNPEQRSLRKEELEQAIEDNSFHEETLNKVNQLDISEEIKKQDEKKIKTIEQEIKKAYQKGTLVDETKSLQRAFKEAHLTEDDFKNIPEWKELTREQKMLVAEQASQNVLGQVKKLGEERFQEKNKISFKGEQKDSIGSAVKKIWNKTWKSVFISKEEKQVLSEVKMGQIKPPEETLRRLTQKTKDMDLTVKENNGKVFVEFISTNENKSKEENKIIENFNTIADEFSRMPDAWKNKQAAKSTETNIIGDSQYEKYQSMQNKYAEARDALIKSKQSEYEKQSLSKKEALEKTLIDVSQIDYKIAMLQFENTNPDAIAELNRIKNESSWGRLLNNETAWKGIFMGSGWVARSVAVTTLGAMTGPLVASIIGGARARRKAGKEINTAILEGRTTSTLRERKQEGKQGLFDDKNSQTSTLGAVLSGSKANAKEVANFIDADSQIQRLDNLIKKIESTPEQDRQELIIQLKSRLNYIENKGDQGLINFGSQNPGALNYQLLNFMSKAVMYTPESLEIAPKGEDEVAKTAREKLKTKMERHDQLLKKIIAENDERVKNKQSNFTTSEMVRGAMIGAGFSVLGWKIRDWFHGAPDDIRTESGSDETFAPRDDTYVKPPLMPDTENLRPAGEGPNPFPVETPPVVNETIPHKAIEIPLSSKGSIQTFLDLKAQLRLEYGKDLAHAPASVQHILNTNATKLADEFNMYNPTDVDESMMAPAGSKFIIDEKGNFSYQELGARQASALEEATSVKATAEYKGKMFDADATRKELNNLSNSQTETPTVGVANQEVVTPSTDTLTETPITTPGKGLHEEFNTVFPPNEEIQGTTRGTFRSFVYKTLEGSNKDWTTLPKADKDAEIWLYEKFGKISFEDSGNGRMSLSNPIDPSTNLGFDIKNSPVTEIIKTNSTVALGIKELQKIAHEQLGYDVVPNKNESVFDYTHRVFNTIDQASKEQFSASSVSDEFNPTERATGKILPSDYMAEQNTNNEMYAGQNSADQNDVRFMNASNTEGNGPERTIVGGGPEQGKIYTETLGNPKHPINWEHYRDHKIISADDVKGRNEIIGVSPNTTDRGITYRDWNRVFDNSVLKDNVKFGSYNQYETEKELQLLFGHGAKNGNTISMDYFRERPEWATVSKIPARYFYNQLFGNEYLSHYPREVSLKDLEILGKAGLIQEVKVPDASTGAITKSIQFIHQAELARLVQAYRHINPNEAGPYQNETIEDYVGRLMKKVHQAQDGTLFARKHDVKFDEAGQILNQQAPMQQAPFTPDNPGVISPTRGVYNTGGYQSNYGPSNYGPNYGPSNYGPSYGQPGYGYMPGFNTGSRQGDVIVGGAQVAQTAINEGIGAVQGNAPAGGGKRILNSAVQSGVQVGVNEIMRQIFGGRGGYGGGYYGGSNWN